MWLCHFLQTQWAVQVLCLLSVFVSCGVWCGLFWAILPQTWGNTPNYGMCLTLGLRQIYRKPSFFICFPIFSNEISMFPVDFPYFPLNHLPLSFGNHVVSGWAKPMTPSRPRSTKSLPLKGPWAVCGGSDTFPQPDNGKSPFGYGSIPINTIFRGMNIHLPAILMFTRGIGLQ